LLGKEAGLFVASGTMGNLVAQMAHVARGQETIAGREHHLVIDEAAGHAVIVGTSIRSLEDRPDGTVDPDAIDAAFRDPSDPHEPITGLVTIENTHAHSMGQPLTPDYTRRVAAIAHGRGVPLHVDGARFWNAVVALGVRPTDLSDPADTVTFCLSKGLGCPVGSVLAGTRADIAALVRYRRMLGGAMRQSGVLAAAGLYALEHHVERLAEDHINARLIGGRLFSCAGVAIDLDALETNIIVFGLRDGAPDAATVVARAAQRDVHVLAFGPRTVRAVTHLDVSRADCELAADALADAVA
jgi:threonine aldolase